MLIDAPRDIPSQSPDEEIKEQAVLDDRVVLINKENAFI